MAKTLDPKDSLLSLHANPSTCNPQTPLVRLGKGEAATLDYNIPQSSCFEAKGYLTISIPRGYWKEKHLGKPSSNFYTEVQNIPRGELDAVVAQARLGLNKSAFTVQGLKLRKVTVEAAGDTTAKTNKDDLKGDTGGGKDDIKDDYGLSGKDEIKDQYGNPISHEHIIGMINVGMQPVFAYNMYGNEYLDFQPEPKVPDPRLVICLEYRVCSFLGDYGAGATVKTFSLLPGEETEISIKTYQHRETVSKKSENVLDSFSESSTAELEKLLESEIKNNYQKDEGSTTSDSETQTKYRNWTLDGGIKLSVPKVTANLNGGISGGSSSSTSSSETTSLNESIQHMVSTLDRTLDKHVSQSSAVRNITVNTELTESSRSGEETSTVRKLKNVNESRVLNFVFRQLLQAYHTITYLEDVRFIYSNGYAETKQVVRLDELPQLLKSLFKTQAQANTIQDAIMGNLCNLVDHEGSKHSFLEHVDEQIDNCCGSGNFSMRRAYCRKRKGISQTWKGITVPGIIMGVKQRVIRTDSLITEALIGHGEALDCYNIKLSEAAVEKAQLENQRIRLENEKTQQAIRILDLIEDSRLKAELYKKVFSECCEVPQSGCACATCQPGRAQ